MRHAARARIKCIGHGGGRRKRLGRGGAVGIGHFRHLVVASKAKIKSVADLRGKRVSLGSDGSGVSITAREILEAWHISEKSFKAGHDDAFTAAQLLKDGKIDAFFAVGGVPLEPLGELIASGKARLVAIDGVGRDRLLRMVPSLSADTIAAGAYPGSTETKTVSARALWVVRDSEPESLVFGITSALFNARNHGTLAASHPAAREIGVATAAAAPPAPLHPGAARFYSSVNR